MNKQRIFITGGSGFIGSRLIDRWLQQGHLITVLSRRPEWVAQRCSGQVAAVSAFQQLSGSFDVLVNLAGEGIADSRWTRARKAELFDSRVALTADLARWATLTGQRFKVVLSGSAIGYYGGFADDSISLNEQASAGSDFAARLCAEWEQAAAPLKELTERFLVLRTGVVLGADGGMLKRLKLPFSLGLGGVIGDGRQVLSWIGLEDYCRAVDFLLDGQISGAVNMTAPQPQSNRTFTQALSAALHRPALMPIPAFVAKAAFGEMSVLLLQGQKVMPECLTAAGFQFEQPHLHDLLSHIYHH